MQRQEDGVSRLKRVILIGDHHQLPPVVKNMAFQKYSHLDQSLFTRFVRLGTPYVQLNAQVNPQACFHMRTVGLTFLSLRSFMATPTFILHMPVTFECNEYKFVFIHKRIFKQKKGDIWRHLYLLEVESRSILTTELWTGLCYRVFNGIVVILWNALALGSERMNQALRKYNSSLYNTI